MSQPQFQSLKQEEPKVIPTIGVDELWTEVFEMLKEAPNSDQFVQFLIQDKYGKATEWNRQGRLQHAADEILNRGVELGNLTIRIHDGQIYFRLPESVFISTFTSDEIPERTSYITC